ncbi:DUF3231 family protein|uniref:DUF3231 family protein n=1 Tax=Dendrosporobacter quercicolus TaxID=146817 RepID=A0A1G9TRN7_9FIRM|nr:DUF3231 family protein [Dendrosporobacter quercicolus]NSL48875.1 DUF3231 family protein [Dendrosporobacter quercicolus DSM 1736]SDM50363.1 Protein of unknown function [Dendrosporobacter quercicolus]
MPTANKYPLTSAEIGNLWNMYMSDTLIVCVKKYLIAKAEDQQIRTILQQALTVSEKRSRDIAAIFRSDNVPIPVGFSDKDVTIEAPRLYSDTFALYHVLSRAKYALQMTAPFLFLAARPDVRNLFQEAVASSAKILEDATQVALTKGILIRSPIVSIPQTPHFVEKSSYIGHIIGKQRPIHVVSLMHIFLSIQENLLGTALITGFGQVARDPELKKYFLRGAEIGIKQTKGLSSRLRDEAIPIPSSPDSMLTSSTIPPFSDKLMMNHIILINQFNLADIGAAVGQSSRADVATDYMRMAAEVIQYGEDGINIAIKNGWLEAPPQVLSHKELALSGKSP